MIRYNLDHFRRAVREAEDRYSRASKDYEANMSYDNFMHQLEAEKLLEQTEVAYELVQLHAKRHDYS